MGGALIQILAYGVQDVHLTGNPDISFFKFVYRKHTNFAIGSTRQTFVNPPTSSSSGDTNHFITIKRDGDLLSRLWLEVHFPCPQNLSTSSYTNWCNNTGAAYVKECEFKIGESSIDRYESLWLDVRNELYDKNKKEHLGLNKHPSLAYRNSPITDLQLSIHLPFWFNEPGLSLPLIALQYHECQLRLKLRNPLEMIISDVQHPNMTIGNPNITLWADYVYLDEDERRKFAQNKHEYLIEQHHSDTQPLDTSHKLYFNHPVKELIWVFTHTTRTNSININNGIANPSVFNPKLLDSTGGAIATNGTETIGGNDYFNYQMTAGAGENTFVPSIDSGSSLYSSRSVEHFDTLTIELHGVDRVLERKAYYYRTVQPLQARHRIPDKHIYCYSFALYPELKEPTGTCNFSTIHDQIFKFNSIGGGQANRQINVFSISYNILVINGGQGGYKYAN